MISFQTINLEAKLNPSHSLYRKTESFSSLRNLHLHIHFHTELNIECVMNGLH